ncbi:MAG: hypothetical protein Q9175_000227 [Cornicularia normoerica]
MDFSTELRKRNTDLVVVVDDAGASTPAMPKLVAYMIFVHLKAGKAVLLHKICVLEDYRRRGIAKIVLEIQAERLKKQGCSKIQLWVDEGNVPARRLYKVLGLEELGKGLPSQNALAAAAFLTPRLHEFRDLHSGRDGTRPAPSLK